MSHESIKILDGADGKSTLVFTEPGLATPEYLTAVRSYAGICLHAISLRVVDADKVDVDERLSNLVHYNGARPRVFPESTPASDALELRPALNPEKTKELSAFLVALCANVNPDNIVVLTPPRHEDDQELAARLQA